MSIADQQRLGWLPLRHHADIEEGSRNVVYGLNFERHDTEAFKNPKVSQLGDLQFYHYWPKIKGKRDMGAWSNASPAVIVDGGALPILDDTFDADTRLDPQEVTPALGRVHAKRTPGIVLGGMDEKEEHKLFFPTGGPMVAHHGGKKAPIFSADVYDITNADELSDLRKAGLHSAFWVKFLPQRSLRPFLGQPAIAWNLTQSTGDFSGHGLIVAPADVSRPAPLGQSGRGTVLRQTAIPPADILAMTSASMSGPLHPGHVGDKHQIGTGVDGPLNSAHISANAYFYFDSLRDAPLSFEREKFPKVDDFGFPHLVHRRYDPDSVHRFLGDTRKGLWREYVNVPWLVVVPPDNTPETPPTPPDYPGDPTTPPPTNPPVNPPVGPPGSGDLGGGNRGPIVVPLPPDDSNPLLPPELQPIGEGFKDTPDFRPGGSVRVRPDFESRANDRVDCAALATPMRVRVPGLELQAHPSRTLDRYEKYKAKPSDKFIEQFISELPVVANVEAFGHERTPGDLVSEKTKSNCPKITGKGGLFVSSPQSGIKDYPAGFRTTNNITKTNVDIVLDREKVRLMFGRPDTSIGEGINGVGMFLNNSSNLQIGGVDEVGSSDESKFALFNMQVSVQGTGAPNFYLWNTDTTSSDEDSGYAIFLGRTGSSSRSMRLRMHHPTSGVQALGIYDGSTEQASIDEYGVLHLTPATAAQAATRASFGKFFANSDDSDNPYYRRPDGTLIDLSSSSGGDVTGPGSSTDNALARFDGATGKIIQNSTLTLSDDSGGQDLTLNTNTNGVARFTVDNAFAGGSVAAEMKMQAGNSSGVLGAWRSRLQGSSTTTNREYIEADSSEIEIRKVEWNSTSSLGIYLINDGNNDVDFIVDSSGVDAALAVDGGEDQLIINATTIKGNIAQIMGGRLGTTLGDPTTGAASSTLYYTPYLHNKIALYNGSDWVMYEFTERSVAVPSTTATNYDVFIYDSSGTLTLEMVAWTNDITRATAITKQDGIYVKSGAVARRYLGTVRTSQSVSGNLSDGDQERFVWNYYNRIPRRLFKTDSTSHTYNTSAVRRWRNVTTNDIHFVIGVVEDSVSIKVSTAGRNNSNPAVLQMAVGIYSTTPTPTIYGRDDISVANVTQQSIAFYEGTDYNAGYSFFAPLQNGGGSGGTTTWDDLEMSGWMLA